MENLSSEKYLSHSETFNVAVDEVDFSEHLKPSAALQYFQDLATLHADELGIGFQTMLNRNLIWVLSRISLRFRSYPKIGERVRAVTYPRKPHIADAIRDYYLYGEGGELLVTGSSKWCVIDVNNHMIRRCAPLFDYPSEVYIPEAPFENANKAVDELDIADPSLSVSVDRVRISELDRNKHMNNARYGDIVLNACDLDFVAGHSVAALDLNFINELKYGDEYSVYTKKEGLRTVSQTMRGTDVIFRAEALWR